MKKILSIIVLLTIVVIGFVSCRNGKAAQEALQVVKKYSGKMFKSAEKESFYIVMATMLFAILSLLRSLVLRVRDVRLMLGAMYAKSVMEKDMFINSKQSKIVYE